MSNKNMLKMTRQSASVLNVFVKEGAASVSSATNPLSQVEKTAMGHMIRILLM